MPQFYRLEPEVAGGLGQGTVLQRDHRPPKVTRLYYVFDGWLGDDLLESYPCFIMTKIMADRLLRLGPTGVALREVEISTSPTFRDGHSNLHLPDFLWLDVQGTPGRDDLGLEQDAHHVVSHRVLDCLRTGHLAQCRIESYSPM